MSVILQVYVDLRLDLMILPYCVGLYYAYVSFAKPLSFCHTLSQCVVDRTLYLNFQGVNIMNRTQEMGEQKTGNVQTQNLGKEQITNE